jgi:hypothetical protein
MAKSKCAATNANTHLPAILALDPKPRAPRVFAMQFKQELRHVDTYATFRTKINCMIREYVLPHLAKHRPNVVVFNEDIGLMTLGTGSRGAEARQIFQDPSLVPGCEPEGAPCGALGALLAISAAYSPQIAAYESRFPGMGPLVAGFVGPTDTLARGWMQTFSNVARRYGIYIAGSATQAPFRQSSDPDDVALFADPDLPKPPKHVYVATEGAAYNTAFLWGPHTVHRRAPKPLRNVVLENRKVPVTPIEKALEISNGPSSGPAAKANLRPYRLPGTRAKLGFATSLPAFQFGNDLGGRPPARPCADVTVSYMNCLDHLGANVVLQDEANPGRWTANGGGGFWQPLEWMGSTWRTVADPAVSFAYNVTPMMVGNLADLPFDGQSAITQRGATRGRGCHYVGNRRLHPNPPEGDPASARRYIGRKRQFLALAPWVTPNAGRARLRATGAKLAPGSGDRLENDYVETALVADLPFPVDRSRRACVR